MSNKESVVSLCSPNLDTKFLSIARVFAIIWVVLVQHNFAPYSTNWGWVEVSSSNPFSPYLLHLTSVFSSISMPIVFCVAGFLFKFRGGDETDFFPFIKKKAMRLLIPCYVLGIAFQLLQEHCMTWRVLVGYAHLWFIFDLFVIFCVAKFLYRYKQLWFVILQTIAVISVCIAIRGISNGMYTLTTSYLFFSLGYIFCHRYEVAYKHRRLLLFVFVIGIAIKFLLSNIASGQLFDFIYAIFMLYPFLYAFRFVQQKIEIYDRCWFNFLNKYSYGIYLFHMIFLFIIYDTFQDYHLFLIDNYWWFSTIAALSTIPLSLLATFIIKKIGFQYI